MSSYEFWDELGKIFSAVVSYQEKSIEFNKRFIVPWIRLGNVFDKQDRNEAAINAYEQAIQIDPKNAQNWYELGNVHFKAQHYSDAIHAFNRAIELDPGFGGSYNNLGLTLVTLGEHEQAIPLYRRSIDLLRDKKDKAVAWNRLGNAYRKLSQYEQALEAFHQADKLDKNNAGFRDDMDEVSEGPSFVESMPDGSGTFPTSLKVSPIELIVAQSRAEEAASQQLEIPHLPPSIRQQATAPEPAVNVATQNADPVPAASAAKDEAAVESIETVTVVVPEAVETFTATIATTSEASDISDAVASTDVKDAETPQVQPKDAEASPAQQAGPIPADASDPVAVTPDAQTGGDQPEVAAEHNAYEEYLKDNNEPVHLYAQAPQEGSEEAPTPAPVAKLDSTGDVQIEMDTKNAHVWNELGNVYFNTGAYDDAIVAYSKAIELDRWFAWPYSNLALAYVQRRRFVEAILLYQRSIELFTGDKDKAVSWNRLGNVYRRLNDYENAIAAYQRADSLDPDNATLSLQSRFSLLGNYATDRKPSYVS
jgi:tetratricopeptide (TPR) repeat protein